MKDPAQPQNSAAPSYLSPASRSSPSVAKPSASSLIVNSIFRSITSDPGHETDHPAQNNGPLPGILFRDTNLVRRSPSG